MTTPAFETEFRVVSLVESGNNRVNVNFTNSVASDGALGALPASNVLTLNLEKEEASTYFPGQVYSFTLTQQTV